ncbi:hypothetical protein C7974DRAFT_94380 [Boeremia exigua]|uniref:uncharacterized protein n=1 Tax=Boeremia exigua TaxID=749465 RepID=UPI001E8D8661|nr:uncharacterized protein C7974DRAFT_94380 [Boeremia exigua]KAH6642046.1 hypothetical protein C7974DRAFT_94380 [Boeremia exigua]
MHSLSSLPREIRDQIIDYVILSCKDPPHDPAHDVQSREDAVGQGALRLPILSLRTYNAFGLLGTSSQLRAETQDRLNRLRLTYSLDVMVVDNELWPTWICCPTRAFGPVDTVKVSLRFFSKPNDPYMVHVARTVWAILRGRTWTNTSLHPLAALFLHIHDVCVQSDQNNTNAIKTLCFDAATTNHLDHIVTMGPSESLSGVELKSLFGKHRSLWNSFRSIRQYPFSGSGGPERLGLEASLKIMVVLFLQESWEDECAIYTSYVGPLGAAFRSVQNVLFAADGQELGQLTCRVLST